MFSLLGAMRPRHLRAPSWSQYAETIYAHHPEFLTNLTHLRLNAPDHWPIGSFSSLSHIIIDPFISHDVLIHPKESIILRVLQLKRLLVCAIVSLDPTRLPKFRTDWRGNDFTYDPRFVVLAPLDDTDNVRVECLRDSDLYSISEGLVRRRGVGL